MAARSSKPRNARSRTRTPAQRKSTRSAPRRKVAVKAAAKKFSFMPVAAAPVPVTAAPAPSPAAVPAPPPVIPAPAPAAPPSPAAKPAPAAGGRKVGAWASVLVIALLLGAIAYGVPAMAEKQGNAGTIKVHDEAQADPAMRNEPHVDCDDVWIEGFNMADGSGWLVFYSWPPTGDMTEVHRAEWTADAHDHENGGFHFLSGPFMFEPGHYRVEAFSNAGHPGSQDHFAKAKMFWVEPCDLPPEEPELACPTALVAATAQDGGFIITWEAAEGSDGSNLYRAVGDGDFEFVTTTTNKDFYHDEDVEPGVVYTYTVTGLFGNRESTGCAEAQISMIPDLPTFMAVGAAAVLGTLGYAMAMRRRKA